MDGLPNNSVYSILKDSRGILWLGTENGISAIKNKTNTKLLDIILKVSRDFYLSNKN